jgi:pyruvate dehydrogenase E2 component (dihydrolipoamide acetyltransferase)
VSKQFDAITIPKWGIEMTHGRIVAWKYSEGDRIGAGVELVEIETDKIVNSFEARVTGTLARILVPEGEELPVGALIGVVATGAYGPEELEAFIAAHSPDSATTASDTPADSAVQTMAETPQQQRVNISPALSRKLTRAGVDPASVAGSGYEGRILKADADRAIAQQTAGSSGASDGVELGAAQRVVAQRLSKAQASVPLFHLQYRLDMDDALARFRTNNPGISGAVNILLMQAMADGLMAMPELNISFDGEVMRPVVTANVALAVARDDNAVVAPVISGVEGLDAGALAEGLAAAIDRGRTGRLGPGDQGIAAVAISNLGAFGVRSFTAMVTPPQVMVLSVGALQRVPVWDVASEQFMPRQVLDVTLGCDHRVVNGAQGAALLQRIDQFMQRQ